MAAPTQEDTSCVPTPEGGTPKPDVISIRSIDRSMAAPTQEDMDSGREQWPNSPRDPADARKVTYLYDHGGTGACCGCAKGCCWNVPFCGGCCAPNFSTEATWLRRLSNEWTVPPPLRKDRLRRVLEHGKLSRFCGRLGTDWGQRHRSNILLFAAFVSAVAALLLVVGLGGASTTTSTVQALAWSVARGTLNNGDEIRVDFGLAADVFSIGGQVNHTEVFTQCRPGPNSVYCEQCHSVVNDMYSLVGMAIFTQIPQFATDVQRVTPYGDLNCQKLQAVFTGIFGMFSTLASLVEYREVCIAALPEKLVIPAGFIDGVLPPVPVEMELTWGPGLGLQLVLIATLLKLVDVLCHLLVPTPVEKQTKERSDTLVAHMLRCPEKTTWGRASASVDYAAGAAETV